MAAKEYINYVIYLILFGTSIFVNKYVLSVLNFIYPTVFQGWQTLIGGILLKILLSNKLLPVTSTSLDKPGFVSLLPTFLFFSAGIVASSKALTGLNVSIFLCLQNTLNAYLYIIESFTTFKGGSRLTSLFFCLLTIFSAISTAFYDIEESFSESPYIWMLVYVFCLVVQNLHSKITDERYNDVDKLYYCYIFSVIVLAPSSLYLEEAFDVLKFPHVARIDFYGSCLLSGIIGVFLNIYFNKVRFQPHFCVVDASSRLLLSLLSLVVFDSSNSLLLNGFIVLNFISSIFVPPPKADESKIILNESFKPLMTEEL